MNSGQQPRDCANAGVALLLVDVINGFVFTGSEPLQEAAGAVARHIRALAASARGAGVPVIYVNDNFGMWQSDFRAVIENCLREDSPGRKVTEQLLPTQADYFVLKPRHSGFLATPLEALLAHLEVHVLCIAGFATDLCVLFTALDAYARGFHVVVPVDCTAANDETAKATALSLVERTLRAPTVPAAQVDWSALARLKRKSLF